jgi:phytoene dehydrogenase-like protein
MPQPERFEVLVLGSGTGGKLIAWHLAQSGHRTAVVERRWVGGSCPNIEATVRYAAELGYEVTVVKDATADYSDEMMHAALDINIPNYASAVVTTSQIVASISAANVMDGALRQ